MPPHAMSRIIPPANPAPIAAEPQSNPVSTLCTTGASGSTTTRSAGAASGAAGRALATGAASARTARAIRTRRVMRFETFMTASFRGGRGVDAEDALGGRSTAGLFSVDARLDRLALTDIESGFVNY